MAEILRRIVRKLRNTEQLGTELAQTADRIRVFQKEVKRAQQDETTVIGTNQPSSPRPEDDPTLF